MGIARVPLMAIVATAGVLLAACGGSEPVATIDLPEPAPSAASTPRESAPPAPTWSTPQATADPQQQSDPTYVPGEERYAFPEKLSVEGVKIDDKPGCNPFDTYTDEEILQAVKAAIVFAGDVSLNTSLLQPGTSVELAEAALNDYVSANALEDFRDKRAAYEAIKADMRDADNAEDAFANWVDADGEPTQRWRDAMDAAALVKYDMANLDTSRPLYDDKFSWLILHLSACSSTDTDGIRVTAEITLNVPITGTTDDSWWVLDDEPRDFEQLDHMVTLQMVPNRSADAERPWLVDRAQSTFNAFTPITNRDFGGDHILGDREEITPMQADTYPWPRTYLP